MILTKEHLRAIAPFANDKLITAMAPAVNYWFPIYGMADKRVASMALGQWAEETDGFKTFREYASGAAYQGRMGNVQPGDGVKFAGMGPDMITGRDNDTRIAKETGLDLVNHPELLLNANEGVHASCQFWVDNGLIPLALAGNEHEVTHRINGGFNGEAVRVGYIHRAQLIITEDLDIPAHVAAIGAVQPPLLKPPPTPAKPPARGFWAWLLAFFKPAPVGNRQINSLLGDTNMTTTVTAAVATHTNNAVTGALGGLAATIIGMMGNGNLTISQGIVGLVATLIGYIIHSNSVAAKAATIANEFAPMAEAMLPANMKVFADYLVQGLSQAVSASNAPVVIAAPAPATTTTTVTQ